LTRGGYVQGMLALKLKQTRDGVCVVLPDELLGQLGASKGDSLAITKCSDGYHLARLDSELAELVHGIEVLERVLDDDELDLPRQLLSRPPIGLAE
jgi:bifunctional DNA-binding transcriptional regulator/antitoxin component of YhaV-PrlF toxin-antitoxin module